MEGGQKHCHMGEHGGQGLAEGCGRFSIIDYKVSFSKPLEKHCIQSCKAETEKMWTGISQEHLRYCKIKVMKTKREEEDQRGRQSSKITDIC